MRRKKNSFPDSLQSETHSVPNAHDLYDFAGAVGYMGTSAFVRKIYTNVKID